MTEIALILFDLNGVLYRYDRDARIAHISALAGRIPAAVRTAIWESGFEDSGDSGAMDADAYLAGFGAQIGFPLTEADWVAGLQASISPLPQTLALLPRLKPGVQCAVLTNNNLLVKRHLGTFYAEVASLAAGRAFVSAQFGLRKPDPDVYLRCLAELGVAPEQVLFIDDNQVNVAGAVDAGLRGHDYADPAGLEAELDRLGLLGP